MSDPVTDNYGLVLPTVGSDGGLWGGFQNNGIFSPLDSILGANFPVTINASDVNLSTSQFQNAIFVLSGVLTGNRSLIVPLSPNSATLACGGRFVVVNNTTGNFNVTVKTAAIGSVGVTVPQGFSAMLYSDKTNVGYATTGLPAFAAAVNGNPNTQLAGTAGSATTNASLAFDYTNGILYVCTTTGNAAGAVWTVPVVTVPRGFDTAVNLGLTITHTGGNLLNIAVKTAAGADATALTPIIVPFQTVSGATTTGKPTSVSIIAALSMDTNAIGASLGSSANVPFRFWIALFNNGGTPVIGIRNCSNATGIFPLAESGVASTVAVSAAATSAGVWYTPTGVTLTNCAFRIIGYVEYTAGLVTPGTYVSDPTNVVLFGPGIKKPGDVIQIRYGSTSGVTTVNNTTPIITTLTASITPTSSINPVLVDCSQVGLSLASSRYINIQPYRGSTGIGVTFTLGSTGGSINGVASQSVIDLPSSVIAITYATFIASFGAYSTEASTGTMTLTEIMG